MSKGSPATSLLRRLWLAAGTLFFGLGTLGLFVPLLPTVVFWLAAVACYARSDPGRAGQLLAHPRFGPALRDWHHHRVIARRGKLAACGAIGLSVLVSGIALGSLRATLLVATPLALLALWIATRPETVARAADG